MLFKKSIRKIGIHIAPGVVAVSEEVYGPRGTSYFDEKRFVMQGRECAVSALLENMTAIDEAAAYVVDKVKGKYADVYLSLAEPFVESKVLVSERDPKKHKNFNEYLKWKLKNEHYVDSDNVYSTFAIIGEELGRHYVLVQLCNKYLIDKINSSFLKRSIPVKVIDASYSFFHNYLRTKVKKERTYFVLHLNGYWLYSAINKEIWPEKIRYECMTESLTESEEWDEHLGQVFSNMARAFYRDMRKDEEELEKHPVIHFVGNKFVDYEHVWEKYFQLERKPLCEFMGEDDTKKYFADDGYIAVERLVAACQR